MAQTMILTGLSEVEARTAAKALATAYNVDVECRIGSFKWGVYGSYPHGSKPKRAQWSEMSIYGQAFLAGVKHASQLPPIELQHAKMWPGFNAQGVK